MFAGEDGAGFSEEANVSSHLFYERLKSFRLMFAFSASYLFANVPDYVANANWVDQSGCRLGEGDLDRDSDQG